nr:SCP2 sterol-binding domain-containing protein [Kibdelosporangium sp. MJ126-NF4]
MKTWHRLADQPQLGVFDDFARSIDIGKLDSDQFVRLIETMDMLGRAGTGVELSALSTSTFIRIIEQASVAQLDALMAHTDLRSVVLAELFARMGRHVRPGAPDMVLHWRFTGGCEAGGYDRYQTVIDNGQCTSGIVQDRDPRATVTIVPSDFLKIATGNASAPLLFLRGRVKVKGDIPCVASFPNHFDLVSP